MRTASAYSPRLKACSASATNFLALVAGASRWSSAEISLCRRFASPVGIVEDQDRPHLFLSAAEITLLPKIFRFQNQVANKTLLQAAGDGKKITQHFIQRLVALLDVLLQAFADDRVEFGRHSRAAAAKGFRFRSSKLWR